MKHRRFPATIVGSLFIILFALISCSRDVIPKGSAGAIIAPTLMPTLNQPAQPATLMSSPTGTTEAAATAKPTSLPSPSPTPTPSSTPVPLTLAVPPEWETESRSAVDTLNESSQSRFFWSIIVDEDPEGALTADRAQMALVNNGSGSVVRSEPLAFSAPFTNPWEYLLPAEAEAILANGHRLIRPIPWSAMTPDNKAMRVDGLHPTDDDYPYHIVWSLVGGAGYETATDELTPLLKEALAPLPTIRIAAVGDLNFDRSVAYIITTTGDLAYPLSRVKPIFDAADYTIGNLETSLGNIGEPAAKSFTFQSPPEAAGALAAGGIDLVTLANNHALDYGPEALLQGIDLLHGAGVAAVGGGADDEAAHAAHIVEIDGLKVAFLGYVNVPVEGVTHFDTRSWTATANSPGLAWGNPERITADVAAVRLAADLVVVILHSGYEYIEEPGEEQMAAAKAAVDAGADLVVGHHAHILQGIQRYNGGVIAYGLGNFLFNIDGPPETAILNVWLDKNGVRQLELIPAIIQEHGQPRPAFPDEATPILDRVYYLSMLLNAANP